MLELVESATLAVSLLGEAGRPRILFAGNASLRSRVAESVGAETELKVADNVRPSVDVESIGPAQSELEAMYQALKVAKLPGFEALRQWSTLPVLPTARAIANVIQYLSLEDTRKGVLGIDVGGACTTIAAARATGAGRLAVRSEWDISGANKNRPARKSLAARTRVVWRWMFYLSAQNVFPPASCTTCVQPLFNAFAAPAYCD